MSFGMPVYVISGALILALSTLTGCRLGNRVEKNTQPSTEIPVEVWSTSPQTLTFCAEAVGQPSAYCRSTTTNHIPAETAQAMTNPLLMAKLPREEFWRMVNIDGILAKSLPVFVEPDDTLSLRYRDSSEVFNSECQAPFEAVIDQARRVRATSPTPSPDGPILGRLELRIAWTTDLSANGCPAIMQAASDCYNDPNGCAQKPVVAEFFAPYLQDQNGNGLPPALLKDIRKITYEVTYE